MRKICRKQGILFFTEGGSICLCIKDGLKRKLYGGEVQTKIVFFSDFLCRSLIAVSVLCRNYTEGKNAAVCFYAVPCFGKAGILLQSLKSGIGRKSKPAYCSLCLGL